MSVVRLCRWATHSGLLCLTGPALQHTPNRLAMSSTTSPEPLDHTQVQYLEEQCILLDDQDNVIGKASKKDCHLAENLFLHRAFSVFLFNSQGELLLQQRALEKITFPGVWTNTCCSHPLYVKDEMEVEGHAGVKRAARRKLDHELGIEQSLVELDDLKFLSRIHYKAVQAGDKWGEHEIDYLFFMKKDVPTNFNPNEIKALRFFSLEQMKEFLALEGKTDPSTGELVTFSPWFRLICENFLFKWWPHLDTIIKHNGLQDAAEAAAIHKL